MSRFDYRDPNDDPAYGEGLSSTRPCAHCRTPVDVGPEEEGLLVLCDACERLRDAQFEGRR